MGHSPAFWRFAGGQQKGSILDVSYVRLSHARQTYEHALAVVRDIRRAVMSQVCYNITHTRRANETEGGLNPASRRRRRTLKGGVVGVGISHKIYRFVRRAFERVF